MEWRPEGSEQPAVRGRQHGTEPAVRPQNLRNTALWDRRWEWGVSTGQEHSTVGPEKRERPWSCEPQPGACSPGKSLGLVLKGARTSHPRNSDSVAVDGEEIAGEAGRSAGCSSPDQDHDGRVLSTRRT